MEKFSHDLSLALEETSRITGSRKWTARRRTRSTGNLPCAPQPTEDSSSSSPEDGPLPSHCTNGTLVDPSAIRMMEGTSGHLLSDSDNPNTTSRSSATRFPLSVSARPDVSLGNNFESDSLNEAFSPARPCARRKRKFKRMAVEYDTSVTAGSGTATNNATTTTSASHIVTVGSRLPCLSAANVFPIEGRARIGSGSYMSTSKSRFGSCQENFRANVLFCGKRKRSHRDRYDFDHHHHHHHRPGNPTHLHSSSVPRGRELLLSTACATTPKGLSHQHPRLCNGRIQPLNKNIISKIEKIAQESSSTTTTRTSSIPLPLRVPRPECEFKPIDPLTLGPEEEDEDEEEDGDEDETMAGNSSNKNNNNNITIPGSVATCAAVMNGFPQQHQMFNKASGSLESNFSFQEYGSCSGNSAPRVETQQQMSTKRHSRRHRHKRSAMGMQMLLQFDDPSMDCNMEDALSSSSLSSSDSDTDKTCDSDREGDDELTDWPGNNEATTTTSLSGGSEFKRTKSSQKGVKGLPLIKSDDTQDEDTRMSADDTMSSLRMQPVVLPLKPGFVSVTSGSGFMDRGNPTLPIDMPLPGAGMDVGCGAGGGVTVGVTGGAQIESEMSGETSNHFLSSPNGLNEVREFRAGCRRVREERPSFSVITSKNEDLSRFLQDGHQTQLYLPDTDSMEHEKLSHLAKLYSLHMRVDRGVAILTKTSNTTQPVRVDRSHMSKRYLSDFKRRCYEDEAAASHNTTTTTEEQEMNDIQS